MRILAVNSQRRIVGGAETYLRGVLPGLAARGHDVALLYEHDAGDQPAVFDGQQWAVGSDVATLGASLHAARAWHPDVVFQHAPIDRAASALRAIAPVVHLAHDYAGACISGLKTWQSVPRPCSRPLGPACLLHYYPHRCGGLDPRTMWRDWRRQRRRQGALRTCAAVVVASTHMRDELIRQGCEPARVHVPGFYVPGVERALQSPARDSAAARPLGPEARLLFAGRLDRLKGLTLLLEALPLVEARLQRPVRLVVAGDGPHRQALEQRAALLGDRVEFAGWCDAERLAALMRDAVLLVVPSIWPEPFGLVGPEAGAHGLPAVAFAVGGIPDWLEDGVNGRLVDSGALSPEPLAAGIADCFADDERRRALSEGARRLAARFRLDAHLAALERIFAAARDEVGLVARGR